MIDVDLSCPSGEALAALVKLFGTPICQAMVAAMAMRDTNPLGVIDGFAGGVDSRRRPAVLRYAVLREPELPVDPAPRGTELAIVSHDRVRDYNYYAYELGERGGETRQAMFIDLLVPRFQQTTASYV